MQGADGNVTELVKQIKEDSARGPSGSTFECHMLCWRFFALGWHHASSLHPQCDSCAIIPEMALKELERMEKEVVAAAGVADAACHEDPDLGGLAEEGIRCGEVSVRLSLRGENMSRFWNSNKN